MYKFILPHKLKEICESPYVLTTVVDDFLYEASLLLESNGKEFEDYTMDLPSKYMLEIEDEVKLKDNLFNKIKEEIYKFDNTGCYVLLIRSATKIWYFELTNGTGYQIDTNAWSGINSKDKLFEIIKHKIDNYSLEYKIIPYNEAEFYELYEYVDKWYYYNDAQENNSSGAGQISGWLSIDEAEEKFRGYNKIRLNEAIRLKQGFEDSEIILKHLSSN